MTPTPETKPLVATPLSGEGMDRHRALIGLKGIARLLAEIVHARAGGPSVPTEEIKHGIARLKEAHDTLSALSAEPLQQSDQGGGATKEAMKAAAIQALDGYRLCGGVFGDTAAEKVVNAILALSPSGSPCRNSSVASLPVMMADEPATPSEDGADG